MTDATNAVPDSDSDPYVDGARDGNLMLQRCTSCERWQFHPRRYCRHCHAPEPAFATASGAGVVHSFTVVRRAPSAAFADRVPYVVALVELAEGPRMMSNLVDCPVDDAAIGLAVELTFDAAVGDGALPCFRPAAAGGAS